MPLLFQSTQGPWSVWTCECCGEPVKFTNLQAREWTRNPKLYITSHAPIGCTWERKGEAYTFEAHTSPVARSEKSALLTDDWDEKTPLTSAYDVTDPWDEDTAEWFRDTEEES